MWKRVGRKLKGGRASLPRENLLGAKRGCRIGEEGKQNRKKSEGQPSSARHWKSWEKRGTNVIKNPVSGNKINNRSIK